APARGPGTELAAGSAAAPLPSAPDSTTQRRRGQARPGARVEEHVVGLGALPGARAARVADLRAQLLRARPVPESLEVPARLGQVPQGLAEDLARVHGAVLEDDRREGARGARQVRLARAARDALDVLV